MCSFYGLGVGSIEMMLEILLVEEIVLDYLLSSCLSFYNFYRCFFDLGHHLYHIFILLD
jgi:hypothetical protein